MHRLEDEGEVAFVEGFDTERWAEVRRPFEILEGMVVSLGLERPTAESKLAVDALRYALSFAKLTVVRTSDGREVDVSGPLALHARWVRETLGPRIEAARGIWAAARELPEVIRRTRMARRSLLEHLPIDRESLESEVTERLLAVASGGGGGAGYVYPGAYELLERNGLCPDFMVGTSIGALMSMFRARIRRYDFAPLVNAARRLSWGGVFQVLETANRYGLPATLRLRLRTSLGSLFLRDNGQPMRFCDTEIPLSVVVTGITVDALKHDLDYYEHLLDDDVRRPSLAGRLDGTLKTLKILREFLSRQDALRCIALGRDPGTEEFDILDAAGFSSAVPGVIHYDLLRDDPHMHRLLDQLYARYGITRLGEGGLTSNVPAKIAWETVASGRFGRRNVFVLALDCFAPTSRRFAWYPLTQAVRTANVEADRRYADLYLPFPRTLSPMNLVPSIRDAMTAIRWGREEIEPHMPFIQEMCAKIPVLS